MTQRCLFSLECLNKFILYDTMEIYNVAPRSYSSFFWVLWRHWSTRDIWGYPEWLHIWHWDYLKTEVYSTQKHTQFLNFSLKTWRQPLQCLRNQRAKRKSEFVFLDIFIPKPNLSFKVFLILEFLNVFVKLINIYSLLYLFFSKIICLFSVFLENPIQKSVHFQLVHSSSVLSPTCFRDTCVFTVAFCAQHLGNPEMCSPILRIF